MDITLALIDAGLAQPEVTLRHLADDFEEALAVYEQHGASVEYPARAFTVHRVMVSGDSRGYEDIRSVDLQGRVYAIACTDDADASSAVRALEAFADRISQEDGIWSGGIAIAGGRLVAGTAHTPRMGKLRRPQSEAIDQLILAVRSSCALGDFVDAQTSRNARREGSSAGDGGIVISRCPVPTFAYPALARHIEQKGRS